MYYTPFQRPTCLLTALHYNHVGDEKNVHLIALSMFIHSLLINGINAAFVIGYFNNHMLASEQWHFPQSVMWTKVSCELLGSLSALPVCSCRLFTGLSHVELDRLLMHNWGRCVSFNHPLSQMASPLLKQSHWIKFVWHGIVYNIISCLN